jgi:hypothetical protein
MALPLQGLLDVMLQLTVILAFIVLALVYWALLYGGLRLMAAFNLVPKEWFNARSEYLVAIDPKLNLVAAAANSTAILADFLDRPIVIPSSHPTPTVGSIAGRPASTQSVSPFVVRGKHLTASTYSASASQNIGGTSIDLLIEPKRPVIIAAFVSTATSDLIWRS